MVTESDRSVALLRSAWAERMPRALAISLGLAAADPAYAGRIRAGQIAAIARLTPVAMPACCLNGIILLATLRHAGALRPGLVAWACGLFGLAAYYIYGWVARRRRPPPLVASPRAIRRAILHGAVFGALWGWVPASIFPAAPGSIQLLIGCLTASMMCAGGFVLTTVPLAGCAYVLMVMAGASYALLAAGASAVHLSLLALLLVYAAVVVTNLIWNAQLFVGHFLVEAQLQKEITAREDAQAQVAHAQRMTALGELAGGIAHDFNNILQGIAGSAVLIDRHTGDEVKTHDLATRILEATERGGAITRRLLGFARQDSLNAEPLAPADLLGTVAALLTDAFDAPVVVQCHVPEGMPALLADRSQLEIVLVNLGTNARDAMPDGGIVTLRAEREILSVDLQDPPLLAGRYIRISCGDTGSGMDDATLARASEPFFTTKPKGRGTGLGLSMAKGFAEQSGGAFAIASTAGQGTNVTLWFPEADPLPAMRPVATATAPAPVQARHVLVVDDDRQVRETMVQTLADAGFVMAGAEDAPHALEHMDGGARVDALVTDFLMPGIDGLQLIQAARRRQPGLPAILLTGHMGDATRRAAETDPGDPYILLQKPVRPDQLARHLATALEAAHA